METKLFYNAASKVVSALAVLTILLVLVTPVNAAQAQEVQAGASSDALVATFPSNSILAGDLKAPDNQVQRSSKVDSQFVAGDPPPLVDSHTPPKGYTSTPPRFFCIAQPKVRNPYE